VRTFETVDLRHVVLRVMRRVARKTEETARLGTLDRLGFVTLGELGFCRWIHDARISLSSSSAGLCEHGPIIRIDPRLSARVCGGHSECAPALGATAVCAAF
jgi:hypothetical protein